MGEAAPLPLPIRATNLKCFDYRSNASTTAYRSVPHAHLRTSVHQSPRPSRPAGAQRHSGRPMAVIHAANRFTQALTAYAYCNVHHNTHMRPSATAMHQGTRWPLVPCPRCSAAAAASVAAATLSFAAIASSTRPQCMHMYQAVPVQCLHSPAAAPPQSQHICLSRIQQLHGHHPFGLLPAPPLSLALKLKYISLSRIQQPHNPHIAGCSPQAPCIRTLCCPSSQRDGCHAPSIPQPPPCWLLLLLFLAAPSPSCPLSQTIYSTPPALTLLAGACSSVLSLASLALS